MRFVNFFLLLSVQILFSFPAIASSGNFKPILNVLAPMEVLNTSLISQFEELHGVNVRVDFVANRHEYEPRLRAGLRNYDVVISDERILERLVLQKQLKTLEFSLSLPSDAKTYYPLNTPSKINADGKAYTILFVEPLGITFQKKSLPAKKHHEIASWEWLITPELIPFWRQKIHVSGKPRELLLLAFLATQNLNHSQGATIPPETLAWLKKLRLQNRKLDIPVELAFLNNQVQAAVTFRSTYFRLVHLVPQLLFVVPKNTFFNRIGMGVTASSFQEPLAKKFVEYLTIHREEWVSKQEAFLSCMTTSYQGHTVDGWVPYEDDVPFSKRIEGALRDFFTHPEY